MTANMIRKITSSIVNRIIGIRKTKPMPDLVTIEPVQTAQTPTQWQMENTSQSINNNFSEQLEEISEGLEENIVYDNRDDEFDHLIESSSSTKFDRGK